MITFHLGMSHTPWVPERVKSFARLTKQLGSMPAPLDVTVETARAPNWVWSYSMWSRAAESSASHCVFLQDDIEVPPNFWEVLECMVRCWSDVIISLYNGHTACRTLARHGHRWATTSDGLVGIGYVMSRTTVEALLKWRRDMLRAGGVEAITEDSLIDVFAMSTGQLIFHPLPTIVDHDLSIKSTYGNEAHIYRRPQVTWRDAEMLSIDDMTQGWDQYPVHLGRFYAGVHWLCARWVKDWNEEKHKAAEADIAASEFRRFYRWP